MGRVKRTYDHIFFDLDHTLWDFDKNSSETLGELYDNYDIQKLTWKNKAYMNEQYRLINDKMWRLYNKGKISKNELRVERFRLLFKKLGVDNEKMADKMENDYLNNCPRKPHLLPGALEIIKYLHRKYILHIITNGFEHTSHLKIKSSGIDQYFDQVISSESAQCTKPHNDIFYFSLKKAGAFLDNSIMIGDNYATDILGAKKVNMDHVFFNHHNLVHEHKVMYEIQELSEIKNILL